MYTRTHTLKIIESASRSPPGHCRSCCCWIHDLYWKLFARLFYEFEAFCRQGASFGMLFDSILRPLGSFSEQFWTLGVIFEALCSHFLVLKRRRCSKGAPGALQNGQHRFELTFWTSFWTSFLVIFQFFCLKCCCKKHVIFQACFWCVFLAIWSSANQ